MTRMTKKLSKEERETVLSVLKKRFTDNKKRHKGIAWESVETKLKKSPKKLQTLFLMEETGGEPDVVAFDKKTGVYTFVDCSPETPKGRRSICYDKDARTTRKEHAPESSALEMAKEMGVTILDQKQYRALQKLGEFDCRTSSWIDTPPAIRRLGGALFCDRRYETIFTYHNGADSYYGVRGFRGSVQI